MSSPVSVQIPNLIQGISQQADASRDPTQGDAQVNGVSSVGEGLRKRDPTIAVARVSETSLGGAFVHAILRDSGEKYLAVIRATGIQVFDLEGSSIPVTGPGASYLASLTNPPGQVRARTIADFTFITNRLTATAMASDLAPETARPAPHEALVWVKAANYGQTYRVTCNGTTAQITTQVAPVVVEGTTTTTYRISTEDIAEQIRAALASVSGVSISRKGSVLHFTSGSPITIGATDARANSDITCITSSVQSFTSLPTVAPRGYSVEVVGDPANKYDGYYVKFAPRDGAGDFGEGAWVETVAPGVEYKLNAATMPHLLIRMADGSFYFGPANGATVGTYTLPKWGGRTAGDYDTAKDPSFIGYPINDVFSFENRLLFLADENVFQSRAQEYFELFPETTTASLDSDPIDVSASGIDKVSVLKYAVPFQDELIIFSDSAQFRYNSNNATLTPSTARVSVLTQFEIDPGCRPIQVAGSIVMAQRNGQWTQFRGFGVRGAGTALTADAPSISETAASYIPADIFVMAENTTGNAFYALSSKEGYRNRIYTHKYFYNGEERKQSSWSYWEFPGVSRILYLLCVEEVLYLLAEYANGQVWLEKVRVSDRAVDGDSPYPLLLDRRISTTQATPAALRVAPGVYSRQTDTTTWALPYQASQPIQAWSAYGGAWEGGVRIGSAPTGATSITALGNWSGADVFFGQVYEFFYRFTRFRARKNLPSGGSVALNERRSQVRTLLLRYEGSGYFEVAVKPEAKKASAYRFTSPGPQSSGVFRVPICSDGARCIVEITNDTARPCRFLGAEWVGLITGRASLL